MSDAIVVALITAASGILVAIIGLWAKHAFRQASSPDPMPADSRQIILHGRWTGNEGEVLDFVATLKPNGNELTGQIRWTLVKVPKSWSWSKKPGDWGYEFVEGTIEKDKLTLVGKSVDDRELLLPGTVYSIALNREVNVFEGASVHKRTTSGKLSGTIQKSPS
jgi:Bacterial macroglobulin domain 6